MNSLSILTLIALLTSSIPFASAVDDIEDSLAKSLREFYRNQASPSVKEIPKDEKHSASSRKIFNTRPEVWKHAFQSIPRRHDNVNRAGVCTLPIQEFRICPLPPLAYRFPRQSFGPHFSR